MWWWPRWFGSSSTLAVLTNCSFGVRFHSILSTGIYRACPKVVDGFIAWGGHFATSNSFRILNRHPESSSRRRKYREKSVRDLRFQSEMAIRKLAIDKSMSCKEVKEKQHHLNIFPGHVLNSVAEQQYCQSSAPPLISCWSRCTMVRDFRIICLLIDSLLILSLEFDNNYKKLQSIFLG